MLEEDSDLPNFELRFEDPELSWLNEKPPEMVIKREKTARFANLQSADLDQLLDGAHSKSTKYSTKHAVSVYNGEF